jgi:hypothetical protein
LIKPERETNTSFGASVEFTDASWSPTQFAEVDATAFTIKSLFVQAVWGTDAG